jgi:hypothetical protein
MPVGPRSLVDAAQAGDAGCRQGKPLEHCSLAQPVLSLILQVHGLYAQEVLRGWSQLVIWDLVHISWELGEEVCPVHRARLGPSECACALQSRGCTGMRCVTVIHHSVHAVVTCH